MQHLASHAMVDSMVLMLEWLKLSVLVHVTQDTTALLEAQALCKILVEMLTYFAQFLLLLGHPLQLRSPLGTTQSRLMHHTMHEAHSALAVVEMGLLALHSTPADHA
jgi:hypothetical protein